MGKRVRLNEAQMQTLRLVFIGKTNEEISEIMKVSYNATACRLMRLFQIFNCTTRTGLVYNALIHGVLAVQNVPKLLDPASGVEKLLKNRKVVRR